jgi:transcriptional regulator with XRE-family HTH domain
MPNQEVTELRNRILGIIIHNTRDQARVSRQECAAILGISVNRYTSYESGRRAISLPELELLARYLEVPLDTFRGNDSLNEEAREDKLPDPVRFLDLRNRIIGARLRQIRHERDMTQQDVADILDCSPSTISDYEYGRRAIPVAELELIGQSMNIPVDYFRDYESNVGMWHKMREQYAQFKALPDEMREFVLRPINQSYLELAMKLSKMPAGSLRSIAEGLLEITY